MSVFAIRSTVVTPFRVWLAVSSRRPCHTGEAPRRLYGAVSGVFGGRATRGYVRPRRLVRDAFSDLVADLFEQVRDVKQEADDPCETEHQTGGVEIAHWWWIFDSPMISIFQLSRNLSSALTWTYLSPSEITTASTPVSSAILTVSLYIW